MATKPVPSPERKAKKNEEMPVAVAQFTRVHLQCYSCPHTQSTCVPTR